MERKVQAKGTKAEEERDVFSCTSSSQNIRQEFWLAAPSLSHSKIKSIKDEPIQLCKTKAKVTVGPQLFLAWVIVIHLNKVQQSFSFVCLLSKICWM